MEYKQSNDHVTGVLENKTMKDWDKKIFEKIKAEIFWKKCQPTNPKARKNKTKNPKKEKHKKPLN